MRRLTGPLAAIVYDGADWQERYHRKFRARRAVVLACINHAWSFDDCDRVLLDDTAAVSELWLRGEDGRLLGRNEAYKRLLGDWRVEYARATWSPAWRSAADVRQWLGIRAAEVRSHPWPGRTGRTDRAVMLAVLAIATRAGCAEPDCAVRDIALAAGVTARTAARSLRRLAAARWLEMVHNGRAADHAQRWRVLHSYTHGSLRGVVENHVCHYATHLNSQGECHEVWVRLGKAALALWGALEAYPATAADISRRAGVARSTASRQLPKLAAVRLAERRDGGWIAGPATPDEVAAAETWVGENSRVQQRRAAHERERGEHALWRESLRTGEAHSGRADAARRAGDVAARRADRAARCVTCGTPFDRGLAACACPRVLAGRAAAAERRPALRAGARGPSRSPARSPARPGGPAAPPGHPQPVRAGARRETRAGIIRAT